MRFRKLAGVAVVIAGMSYVGQASAHRAWMLPSATVLSGETAWVTMDAAVSNSLFYFEHHPLNLDGVSMVFPDGGAGDIQNRATGKYRSVFDAELTSDGTYTFEIRNSGLFGMYELEGKRMRWRGNAEEVSQIPAAATNVRISEMNRLMQVFVTKGAPSTDTLQITGRGLEMLPVSHPNDLFTGETSEFRFTVDGESVSGLDVVIIRGGSRYRDTVDEIHLETDGDGAVFVDWITPGMYWLEVEHEDESQLLDGAKRRMSYSATLEVLPL